MFQQRGYVKVQIGDDMEALLDQIMDVCSVDFADWSEESGQRGVEVRIDQTLFVLSWLMHLCSLSVDQKSSTRS
jgi:hypothetical protein